MREHMATEAGEVKMSEFILYSALDTTDRKRWRVCCGEA